MSDAPLPMARALAQMFKSWPDWSLILCFIVLAIVFAFMGTLDDWARGVLALTFLGIAVSLIGRFRAEWQTDHPLSVPLPDPSDVGPQPPED